MHNIIIEIKYLLLVILLLKIIIVENVIVN